MWLNMIKHTRMAQNFPKQLYIATHLAQNVEASFEDIVINHLYGYVCDEGSSGMRNGNSNVNSDRGPRCSEHHASVASLSA